MIFYWEYFMHVHNIISLILHILMQNRSGLRSALTLRDRFNTNTEIARSLALTISNN